MKYVDNKKMFLLLFKNSKISVPLFLFVKIVLAFSAIISAVALEKVVDSIVGYSSNQTILIIILPIVALLGVNFLFKYGFELIVKLIDSDIMKKQTILIGELISKKKCVIEYKNYEDINIKDKINNVEQSPESLWIALKSLISIITNIISLIMLMFYLSKIGISFIIIYALFLVPIIYYNVKSSAEYYRTWTSLSTLRRKCKYYFEILFNREYSEERNFFQYSEYIKNKWEKEFKNVRELSLKTEINNARKIQILNIILGIYNILLLILVFYKLHISTVDAGFFVVCITMLPNIYNKIIQITSIEFNTFSKSYNIVKELSLFLNIEEKETLFSVPNKSATFNYIEFKNVSFKYPGTEKLVLKNINCVFEKGKTYSIVGENGSGKTTIIKLLTGLYSVTSGEILIDGVNINNIDPAKLYALISVMFQDFEIYSLSIAENIGLGNINKSKNCNLIKCSAEKIGIDKLIEKKPNKYETILGRKYNKGIELSGGENQKIALARTVISDCPIKILDEPTASFDAEYEMELYKNFCEIMKADMTILISHRLASTKLADHIYVIHQHSIFEEGSFDELMQKEGIYYNMFIAQSKTYE